MNGLLGVGCRKMQIALPGLDLAALTGWLDAEWPGLRVGALTGRAIAGGRSNLTYEVGDGVSRWALRRPPLGHVLPTAHDMSREFSVISGLAGTPVPAPRPVVFCPDPEVIGDQFYLMSFVDGVVLSNPEDLAQLTREQAGRCGELLVDTLVQLHAVDPATVGLGGFGRPEGFLDRQVRRWHRQWQASETRPLPELEDVVQLLLACIPVSSRAGIVHGDYRLTNVMFDKSLESVVAVVDWEMAALGDPLADLGLMYLYHRLAEYNDVAMAHMPPAKGFLSADELVARYARLTGVDLAHLRWYIAFGYYKFAVIAEGIANRYLQGKTVGAGFEHFQAVVPGCVLGALEILLDPAAVPPPVIVDV